MVLVRLHQVEVAAIALSHAVVAVELELGHGDGVLATGHEGGGSGEEATCGTDGAVAQSAIARGGEVEPLLAGLGIGGGVGSVIGQHVVLLHDPDQLGHGVVEGELGLVLLASDGLLTSELELLYQIFVRGLSEAAALICVEIDIIHVQRRGLHPGGGDDRLVGGPGGIGGRVPLAGPEAVGDIAELDVNLNLVVLQSDEGQRQTGVAVEEELKGNVQDLALHDGAGGGRVELLHIDQVGGLANHVGVTQSVTGSLGQLVPDVNPF